MAEVEPRGGRRTFGPVVLLGLGAGALTAVASARPWFAAAVDYRLELGVREPDLRADLPLAVALSLVVLAGWGALLVTRGRVRRAMAGVALLAALGVVACVIAAPFSLPDEIRDRLLAGSGDIAVDPTGWYLTAAVASVVSVLALAAAWRLVPRWPTMSSRYDAPVAGQSSGGTTERDLWNALDEGVDPTEPEGP